MLQTTLEFGVNALVHEKAKLFEFEQRDPFQDDRVVDFSNPKDFTLASVVGSPW